MKNTRLKNVIFTAGMAVFTGVLLLGVNAAIGAATPTVDPPGAGVSPTFTGLNVEGNIQNSSGNNGGGVIVDDDMTVDGALNVTGFIQNSGDSSLILEDKVQITGAGNYLTVADSIVSGGSLTVNGPIMNGGGDTVEVQDNMTVNGALNVTGASNLQGNVSDSGGDFTVGDNLAVTGTSDLRGNVSDSNSAFTIADSLVVTGTSDLRGNVSDSTGAFTIADNLVVTGDVSDSNSAFTIADGLKVTGQVEVNDDIVHGTPGEFVTVNGPFEATDLVNIGNDVMIQNNADITVTGDADIQGAIKNSLVDYYPTHIDDHNVTIDDDLTVTGSINVGGSLTADSIGGFTRPESAFQSIAAGGTAEASIACPENYNILSCGAQSSWTTPSYGWTRYVELVYAWTSLWDDTCIVRGNNTHASANRYIKAIAVCWNPSSL